MATPAAARSPAPHPIRRRSPVETLLHLPKPGLAGAGNARTGRPLVLQLPHADIAEIDQIVVAVVLQPDESAEELPQIRRRVTGPRRLLPRRVVELIDHHAVADHRVVLADNLDLVVVPRALGRRPGLIQRERIEVVDRPGLLRLTGGPVVDLDLLSTED